MNKQMNIPRYLLVIAGIIVCSMAIIYNEYLISYFDPNPPISEITIKKIRSAQIYLLIIGISFLIISEAMHRNEWFNNFVRRNFVENILLLILSVCVPIVILEITLRPFIIVDKPTSIFSKDDLLGWKFKPNSEDLWGKVPVRINGKGLRGPELDYKKPKNTKRILYLGDSVTFGYLLDSYKKTFPYIVDSVLNEQATVKIETINAGIDGYSPWQEFIYLKTEGIKYSPDLIIINFVLNDVTERYGLTKFGGIGEGYQLDRTASNYFDKLFNESGIVYWAKRLFIRIKFGKDVEQGAKEMELLNVKTLAYNPRKDEVKRAWKLALKELGDIIDYAKEQNIPTLIVLFPYTFQFDNIDKLSRPQEIVAKYASEKNVEVIDLLPLMNRELKYRNLKPKNFFLDDNHLSFEGSEFTSKTMIDYLFNTNAIGIERNSPN